MKVAAVVHGTDHARKFLHHIKESGEHFDFVEVMTCPGGCISGGGQTKHIRRGYGYCSEGKNSVPV